MKWTWIIVNVLLVAGCSHMTAYQPPNPCAPPAAQQSPDGGWSGNYPTPHTVSRGTSGGYAVVCE
jgi:hypothetical protein